MNIIRFTTGTDTVPRIGIIDDDFVRELRAASLAELLRESADAFRRLLQDDWTGGARHALADVRLLAPIDGRTEVWAAGVTYEMSQRERMKESEGAASLYQQVYDAERPELFFKSVAWRIRGPGETIAAREDSVIDVPEPELACALGPTIRPAWEIADPYDLAIQLTISRDGTDIWAGSASTADLHRRFGELVDYLLRADIFPDGAVLSTGTSLVPELPFSLADGDVVSIDIENVGRLVNPVVRGRPDHPKEM